MLPIDDYVFSLLGVFIGTLSIFKCCYNSMSDVPGVLYGSAGEEHEGLWAMRELCRTPSWFITESMYDRFSSEVTFRWCAWNWLIDGLISLPFWSFFERRPFRCVLLLFSSILRTFEPLIFNSDSLRLWLVNRRKSTSGYIWSGEACRALSLSFRPTWEVYAWDT